MKLIRLVVLFMLAAVLGACSSAQPISPAQLKQAINNVATLTQAGCIIVQPTLAGAATATANPVAATAAGVNGIFCAAQAPLVAATAAPASAPDGAASAPTAASAPLSGAAPIK